MATTPEGAKPRTTTKKKPAAKKKAAGVAASEKKKRGVGQPTSYRDEYTDWALKLTKLGATDKDMAEAFEVTEQTLNNWKQAHPEFFESIKRAGATPAMRGSRRFRRCPLGAFAENARRQMLDATPVVEAAGAGDSGFAAPCGTRRHHTNNSPMPRKPAWNKAAALAAPCGTSLNRGQLRFALAGPAFRWRGLQALRTSGSTSAPRRRRSR